MTEKALKFGKKEHLVGIITLPDDIIASSERPAILLLNAGLLHRVGPYRLNVYLGRILALDGYLTMRFDLSGIGDSQINSAVSDYQGNVINDIQDAIDFISQRYKIKEFILVGLCSGAINAHLVAANDARIIGIVMIDGFFFSTLNSYYRYIKLYLTNPIKLITAVNRLMLKWFKTISMGPEKRLGRGDMFSVEYPPKQQIANDYRKMVQREVSILCIYSGGYPKYYNYLNQFLDMFKSVDFRDQLQLSYFPKADHIFTNHSERTRLIECIRLWMRTRGEKSY